MKVFTISYSNYSLGLVKHTLDIGLFLPTFDAAATKLLCNCPEDRHPKNPLSNCLLLVHCHAVVLGLYMSLVPWKDNIVEDDFLWKEKQPVWVFAILILINLNLCCLVSCLCGSTFWISLCDTIGGVLIFFSTLFEVLIGSILAQRIISMTATSCKVITRQNN